MIISSDSSNSSVKIVFENKYVRIIESIPESVDGAFYFVGNRKVEVIEKHSDSLCTGGSALAVSESGKICLVKQFRASLDKYVWETPRGGSEIGDGVYETGVREFLEETGVPGGLINSIVPMGRIASDSGIFHNLSGMVFIKVDDEAMKYSGEDAGDDEVIDVQWFSLDEVLESFDNDEGIVDAFTQLAVYKAMAKGYITQQ